MNPLFIYLF